MPHRIARAAAEARGDRAGAERLRAYNATMQTLYPEAATYDNTSAEGRARLIMQEYDRQNSAYKGQRGARESREAFERWVEAGLPVTFEEWASRYTGKR